LIITCSFSGGTAQATLGILHACYVSGLHQDWNTTQILLQPTDIPSVVCIAPPEDEQVMLQTGKGP
jgi:hypothetical protein